MAVDLQTKSLLPSSFASVRLGWNSIGAQASCSGVADLEYEVKKLWQCRKPCAARFACSYGASFRYGLISREKQRPVADVFGRRSSGRLLPLSSTDDLAAVNGRPLSTSCSDSDAESDVIAMAVGDSGDCFVQALHDSARVFELAIKERGLVSSLSWVSAAWLGKDRNAWVKTLSYQGAVYSLLQAATEITSRGDRRDKDANIFIQRSFIRQSALLQSTIKDKLSAKQPAYQWFWSEQIPALVSLFVTLFEEDSRFLAATAVPMKHISTSSGNKCDVSLLLLSLASLAAIIKLGPAKVSCPPLSSLITEEIGKIMDMLINYIPISQAYYLLKDLGLRREFLLHFGPRAASCRVTNEGGSSEAIFWVNLVQKQLQQAIDKERMWSRLTTSESIEILDKDLAIFGFFVALGRNTQSYMRLNGFNASNSSFEGFVRYLIGGSVLYYPQLSSISLYQLFVEVVCEELDWLQFYPGSGDYSNSHPAHGNQDEHRGPPNAEAIPVIIDVCSHWIQSFIKYSSWLESPSNIKAARFLSHGHIKLTECMEEFGSARFAIEGHESGSGSSTLTKSERDSFDKALESVEEALVRLETLLEELHLSRSNSEKDQVEVPCSDLEKIRELKEQAEFLEASLRSKAASMKVGDDGNNVQSRQSQLRFFNWTTEKTPLVKLDSRTSKPRGLWNVFAPFSTPRPEEKLSIANSMEEERYALTKIINDSDADSSELMRFKVLKSELIELEKQVQRSTDLYQLEEDVKGSIEHNRKDGHNGMAFGDTERQESPFGKSMDKLKQTTMDVVQGTQLLAIDLATATGFLQRALIGDELTVKEKKTLSRTLTDLASVIPIGILMLLPVTAVGHAAILAAIQRYVPSLIPSTYGRERLDLLRQLEKMKETRVGELDACGSEELL